MVTIRQMHEEDTNAVRQVDALAFCNCSRGWVKTVFGTVSGRPVEVELKQAIGRGDPVCEFVVRFDERVGRCSRSGG